MKYVQWNKFGNERFNNQEKVARENWIGNNKNDKNEDRSLESYITQ